MNKLKFKTFHSRKEDVQRQWLLIDAKNQILGRLATNIANLLRGKHKAIYSDHVDNGDFVVVINVGQIKVSGDKETKKIYYRHTLFPGGLRAEKFKEKLAKNPKHILFLAVKRMLPKNRLSKKLMTKLKIYTDEKHPHQAQKPKKGD